MNPLLSGLNPSSRDLDVKVSPVKASPQADDSQPKFKDMMDKQTEPQRKSSPADKPERHEAAARNASKSGGAVDDSSKNDAPRTASNKPASQAETSENVSAPADSANDDRTDNSLQATNDSDSASKSIAETTTDLVDPSATGLTAMNVTTGEGATDPSLENATLNEDTSLFIETDPVLAGLPDAPLHATQVVASTTAGLAPAVNAEGKPLTAKPQAENGLNGLGAILAGDEAAVPAEALISPLASPKPIVGQGAASHVSHPLSGMPRDSESRMFSALSGEPMLDESATEAPKTSVRMDMSGLVGTGNKLTSAIASQNSLQASSGLVPEGQMRLEENLLLNTNTPAPERAAPPSAAVAAFGLSPTGLPTVADARVQMPVSITFGESGWGNMIAERSAMMASKSIKFAELQLDPPELGQLQVKVSVNQEQASVSFVAANAQVKDALDQSLGRLKELLQEQGLDLVDVDVSDQSSQQSDPEAEHEGGNTAMSDAELEEAGQAAPTVMQGSVSYGVDHYA